MVSTKKRTSKPIIYLKIYKNLFIGQAITTYPKKSILFQPALFINKIEI